MRHATEWQSLALRPKNDIYVYSVSPLNSTTFLACCSDDRISAFDAGSGKPSLLWTLDTSHKGTTQALTKRVGNELAILTAGNDGAIKIWDPRAGADQKPHQTLKPKERVAPILSLASHPSTSILAVGTELTGHDAALQFWDLRQPADIIHKYTEVHSDDITELHYHPINASCLLSGSVDGLVNIYDTTITDEDDAVFQVLNHGASIHHTDFLENDVIYALSNDEQLSLYKLNETTVKAEESEEEDPSVCAFGDVRQTLECDYIADLINTANGPLIAAGSFSRNKLDLIPLKKTPAWDFRQHEAIRLDKGLGDEIVRSVYIDQANDRVIAGAEDNQIRIWSKFSEDDSLMEED